MSLLAIVVGAHLAVVLARALIAPPMLERPFAAYGAAAIAVVAAIAVARTRAVRSRPPRDLALARAATIAVFLVTRLAWAVTVETQPVSDFAGYHALSLAVARGGAIFMPWPIGGAVAAWGYPVALGFVLGLLPDSIPDLLAAKVASALLGCVSLVLLDRVVRRIFDDRTALVAMVLFTLWPGQLYLTSVLATEHLAVPLLLATLVLALELIAAPPRDRDRGRDRSAVAGAAIAAGVGLGLAAMIAVRSALVATAAAIVIALWRWRASLRQAIAILACVLATLVLSTTLYRAGLQRAYGVSPLDATWWSILTGTNLDSGGSFSTADRDRFFAHRTMGEANAFARDEIAERVATAPLALMRLAWTKTVQLWLADDYAVFWSTESLAPSAWSPPREPMAVAAQAWHVASLALAVVGCALLVPRKPRAATDLLFLVLVCGTLLHALAESQARYHFVLEPLVIALAALGARGGGARSERLA